jgi:hypothetical protein
MNVYIQVLTQAQTSNVADLLLFPNVFVSNALKGCVRGLVGGKMREFGRDSIDGICRSLAKSQFNQLEASYNVAGSNPALPGKLLSIYAVLTPSPASPLWFKSTDWAPGGNKPSRTRRLNAKAAETALSYYKVNQKPAVLECVLHFPSSVDGNEVLDAFTTRLCHHIPECLQALQIFGCADVGGDELFVKLDANVLMTRDIRIMAKLLPSSYPQLGARFDTLHPVMFGSEKTCAAIASALGADAVLTSDCVFEDFAVLRVSPDCDVRSASARASAWLLPLPE